MNQFSHFISSRPMHFRSYIKIINLNFYFHTSLRCLKRFYEDLKGPLKTFCGTTKKCENKNLSWFSFFVRIGTGRVKMNCNFFPALGRGGKHDPQTSTFKLNLTWDHSIHSYNQCKRSHFSSILRGTILDEVFRKKAIGLTSNSDIEK